MTYVSLIGKKANDMRQELLLFFQSLERYVQDYSGPVGGAFHFRRNEWRRFWPEEVSPRLLRREQAGSYLFRFDQPLDSVYILLEGGCCVEKYKPSGGVFTDSSRYPLQMFGLLEGIAGVPAYTATMRCAEDCVCLKAPVETCLHLLRSNPDLMWLALQFLSSFIMEYMDASDLLILHDPEFLILSRLCRCCLGKSFPVTVPYKKEDLANGLNLNLRTVYRYLARFYESGLLSSVRGKITITQQQYQAIESYLSAK